MLPTVCLVVAAALMPLAPAAFATRRAVAAPTDSTGFVAGDERPAGDGPAIRVPGGWMVGYEETIPGTDVTFRMIPIPGGTFRMGSPADQEGRDPHEGPQYEVRLEPVWIGRC
ncbi:MAG: formylglycine-generating enzyme family protein, partial [Planctomycetia bacterium]